MIGSEAEILADEHLAFALVLALRDLNTWVEASPGERPRIFQPPKRHRINAMAHASRAVPEIAPALETISHLRVPDVPPEAGSLVGACRRIFNWADSNALPQIAVRFAEAYARLDPDRSAFANDAARAAKHAAIPDRADVWYERAIGLAGRERNRREKIRGLLGKANLYRNERRYDEARPLLMRAASLAASTRRYREAAEIEHDLYALAVMEGTYPEAERHILSALAHYPVHHPAVPRLVHDWAFLLVQKALYAEAIPLLQMSIPQTRRIEIKLLSWGTLSHAVAGAGHRGLYEEALDRVLHFSERIQEYAAAALAHASCGARFFGEWDLAHTLATQALAVAEVRRETDVAQGVREFLAAIESQQALPPQAEPSEGHQIALINAQMLKLLQARRRPTRRPVVLDQNKEASGPLVPARQAESAS
jgi:tetratricopeptide (TPR) repeat protein